MAINRVAGAGGDVGECATVSVDMGAGAGERGVADLLITLVKAADLPPMAGPIYILERRSRGR
jgi:hypothetical protein